MGRCLSQSEAGLGFSVAGCARGWASDSGGGGGGRHMGTEGLGGGRLDTAGTHTGCSALGEDDEDTPMITGFSDDVPMVIA